MLLLSFVSNIAHLFAHLFLNLFGVAYKRLVYIKRANSNLIADQNNSFSCKRYCEACFRIICVKNYWDKFAPETKLQNYLLLLEEHVI